MDNKEKVEAQFRENVTAYEVNFKLSYAIFILILLMTLELLVIKDQ